jgi:glucose/mannose-6-phosphate isomerase
MSELTREAIEALDSGSMIRDALDQGAQLEDALWRVESANLPVAERPGGLVVCGMGGSAIGADLAAAGIGARARRPIVTVRGYEPPGWVGSESLVLVASYSGDTEEALACYAAAGAARADRIALTTGGSLAAAARADGVPVIGVPAGMQPRAAVAYMVVAALECAALCGAAPRLVAEIEAAAALLGELAGDWGPDAPEDSAGKALARALRGSVCLVYGAGTTAPVAVRWKTQLNENAGMPAFASELPEADHNEICSFVRGARMAQLQAIFLEDPAGGERLLTRATITAEEAGTAGLGVARVSARGESPIERIMSLVLLGDLTSIYLAALEGVDPTPVEPIERLKRSLRQP